MDQGRLGKFRNTVVVRFVLRASAFTLGALCLFSATANAGVRQVASARTADAHCVRGYDDMGNLMSICDPLPQSLTITFQSTLAGSKLILLGQWNLGENGENSINGCTDSLGQNWLYSHGESVLIWPPTNATIAGITSITCQTSFPDPPSYLAPTSSGKWGVLLLHFLEVTGAGPGDLVSYSGWGCSVLPAANRVTILADYTGVVEDYLNYSSSPMLGDYGVQGPANSGRLDLQSNDESSVASYHASLILNSIYASVGSSPATAPLRYPNASYCLTVTVPQTQPTSETGVNLGVCQQCEETAGEPINLTNGNVYINQQDYSLPGLGGGITLQRTWNSLWASTTHPGVPQAGMFGHSWSSTYEERLVIVDSQTVDYWRADGSKQRFRFDISFIGMNFYVTSTPRDNRLSLTFDIAANKWNLLFSGSLLFSTKWKHFDASGRLISVEDRNGNILTLTYDQNRLIQATDAASRQLSFTYGDSLNPNQVTAVQDALGTVATYEYDSSGRLITVSYPDNSFNRFHYDEASLILSVTDTEDKILEAHTYDAYRRGLTSERAGGVERISVAYTGSGTAHLVDSAGNASDYGSSAINAQNVINAVAGTGCATCGGRGNQTFVYDTQGNRLSSTDALNNATSFTYGAYDRDVRSRSITVNGVPITWSFRYYDGLVLVDTDPLGNVTTYTSDSNDNMLTMTTPAPGGRTPASTTSFSYDTKGQLLTITDPLNHVTTFTYSAAGLVETVTDAQNKVTHYEYDVRGNRTAIVDAMMLRTEFHYDLRNRLTSVTSLTTPPVTTSYTYDSRGRRTSVTDANGKTTTYTYDDADRLIAVTDAQTPAGITHYEYDSEDNLINVTDALNRVTHYDYDAQGRLSKTTFPSTTVPSNLIETYIYDAIGNLLSKTDRKHQTITYTYDPLQRLTSKRYQDTTQVNYTYDAASRLTQVTDATGTYQFAYDNMGRLTQTSTAYSFVSGQPLTVGYAWDAASNLTTMTDPQGGDTTYTYDTLNRLATLKNPQRNQFNFTYDALGRRTQMTRPNSVNTNYQYDSLSRVTSLLHQFTNKQGTTTLDGALYSYDAAGNRLSRTNKLTNIVSNYGSDPLYQLTGVTQSGNTTESYSYDAVGNRLSSLGVASYTYNVSNELTNLPGVSYTYDDNGSLFTKNDGSGYSWDFENRLTRVTLPGGAQVNFKYDPMGRRIQKSSSSGTINYVYDGANTLEEVDANRSLLTRYTQSPGLDEPLAILKSGTTSYYEADGLGTVTSLSNTAGVLAKTYNYDSFGKLLGSSGTVSNPYGFTGRESDSETGLMYYRARYYDPSTGRFLSEDPLRFGGGFNFYVYVWNDPIGMNDPLGLRPLTDCEKEKLGPYVPKIDLDNADLHDGKQPWWLPDKKHNIAVTVKNDIYIRKGEYDPTTPEGLGLLAHELYHVGQYRKKEMSRFSYLREAVRHGGGKDNKYEKPAYEFGDAVQNSLTKGWTGPECGCTKP